MMNSILVPTPEVTLLIHTPLMAFIATEPLGVSMPMILIGVVIVALIMLYLAFRYGAKLYRKNADSKKASDLKSKEALKNGGEQANDISGEVNAAIALALHLYRTQLHDNEDPVITMRRVASTYSPWSSKIYGMTRAPR